MPALLTRMSTEPNSLLGDGDHLGDLVGLQHVGGVKQRADAVRAPWRPRCVIAASLSAADPRPFSTTLAPPPPRSAGDGEAYAGGRAGDDRALPFDMTASPTSNASFSTADVAIEHIDINAPLQPRTKFVSMVPSSFTARNFLSSPPISPVSE